MSHAKRWRVTFCVLLLAGAGSALPALARDSSPEFPIPTPEQREAFRKDHLTYPSEPGPVDRARGAALAAQDEFDVQHYFVDIDFASGLNDHVISGLVRVTLKSVVPSLTNVVLDFQDNMTVTGVSRNGIRITSFTHTNDLLDITLTAPLALDEQADITITYFGEPQSGGSLGSFNWYKYSGGGGDGSMVWTLSEPEGARLWWPCKDRPDDKATVEEWWTVPDTWIATGNGVLIETVFLSGGRMQYKWKPTRPLTTYLVSVAATDYAQFSHTYVSPLSAETMPVDYYVYTEDFADAQVSFSNTVAMIGYYAQTFGEYPFLEDKYGMSACPFGGAMEHTTNTSYGVNLINGGHTYDFIIAHELAHQWWGDSVSPQTWPNVWLNEGFASYSEALWAENLGGASGYQDYMNSFWRENFSGTLYNPSSLFGVTVYDKGAWVVHMLRGVMGDQPFFDTLRDWYVLYRDGAANTAQFQAAAEARHGAPLDWFFQEWVYLPNSPRYEYGWTTADLGNGTYRNYVRIEQVQTNAGVFTMPVNLTFVTASGDEVHTVWNDEVDEDFVLDTSEPPTELRFDEKDWILKASHTEIFLDDLDSDGVPDRNDNCVSVGNPVQADFDTDGFGDACDADDDDDLLDDGSDCAPFDPDQGTPDEVAVLDVDGSAGAPTHLSWSAAARADGYDLVRGDLSGLGGSYGSCLQTMLSALLYDDSDLPAAGSGWLYLVRGADAGCGGAGSLGTGTGGIPRLVVCP